jgi:hypothetical protein
MRLLLCFLVLAAAYDYKHLAGEPSGGLFLRSFFLFFFFFFFVFRVSSASYPQPGICGDRSSLCAIAPDFSG